MTDEVEAIRERNDFIRAVFLAKGCTSLDAEQIATLLARVDRLRESVKSAYGAGFRDGQREAGAR